MCINFYHTSTNGTNFSDDDADLYRNIRYIGDFVSWEQECFVTHKLLKPCFQQKLFKELKTTLPDVTLSLLGKKWSQ